MCYYAVVKPFKNWYYLPEKDHYFPALGYFQKKKNYYSQQGPCKLDCLKTNSQEKSKRKFINTCTVHVQEHPAMSDPKGMGRTWTYTSSYSNTMEKRFGAFEW